MFVGLHGQQGQPLTKLQATRLRNYLNASAATEQALSEAPTVQELAEHPSVTASLLTALDVVPARLLAANATLQQLTAIGYGAGHLVRSPGFCAQLTSKYGHTATAAAVLLGPQDAVDLSTSVLVVKTLGLSTRTLLDACCGDQASGIQVIHSLLHQHREAAAAAPPPPSTAYPGAPPTADANLQLLRRKLQSAGPLHGVGCETLARLGIDGRALHVHFGIDVGDLCDTLGVPTEKLRVLGVFQMPG